ncbi:hypothetical protein SAMN04487969_10482 [Paenibacillus algorifonticola]|uniref:Uncharacterized protein n=1 Tax=Paenibacillus algorifonticola TaxID=684063 RepID=A0A1I2BU00_9BACL|nr:hypothetical protein [Paenibacillus algorifonticola]SFE59582.1 hypothetical protein SAMN04487969_10482 [Paenibacillus algorifonticola]
METTSYLFFSILDAIAMVVLMIKSYRQPLAAYKWNILFICIGIACWSYAARVVVGLSPYIDILGQFLIFAAFFRYFLKIRLVYSGLMVAVGYAAYVCIQFPIYFVVTALGVSDVVAQNTGGNEVIVIQFFTDAASLVVGWLITLFNYGFTFIVIPPHDLSRKERLFTGTNGMLALSTLATVAMITTSLYLTVHYDAALYAYPLVLWILGTLYFLSRRRESEDDRIYITKNGAIHKKIRS